MANSGITFPVDPLEFMTLTSHDRRRAISGILESYNGAYDVLTEAVQNAVDAVEDSILLTLKGPRLIHVTVNLKDNWISVLDTGVGMTADEISKSFTPNKSFKDNPDMLDKRRTCAYRGYKGVGLTFLAYATDHITVHTKRDGSVIKCKMEYAHAWAVGERNDGASIVADDSDSPLDDYSRGTYVKVQFSPSTRPKSLSHLASNPTTWITILRTRTAIGQINLQSTQNFDIDASLTVVTPTATKKYKIPLEFYYPHLVARKPPFRFLDVVEYYRTHPEKSKPPTEKTRQDGIYLVWDTERIKKELTDEQQKRLDSELKQYTPTLYAFVPYTSSIWGDINEILTGTKNRTHLYPGLIIGLNRQRLAEKFEIEATRFESFSRNVLVIVHLNNAKPDQGRKTFQEEVFDLAKRSADRAVQYLADQREFLKPPGDAPTPDQREVEKGHEDWSFNVKTHAKTSPLHQPPITYISSPQQEQDVVGLFHQLSAVGIFSGIQIYATSQIKTYDCLITFDCVVSSEPKLRYVSFSENPLGVTPYILGNKDKFSTRHLTVEFKNNLDALIDELAGEGRKRYDHIDICVCWGTIDSKFDGYSLVQISEAHSNLDERAYPGTTHILRRNSDAHTIQIVMLKTVIELIKSGNISIGKAALLDIVPEQVVPKKKVRK
jgi:hypothetical protein